MPNWSIARTEKVCAPSASAVVGVWAAPGPLQGANVAESKRHWKVELDSDEVKPKVGVGLLVGPLGPASIVVSGAAESSVYAIAAEQAEAFAPLVAVARRAVVELSGTETAIPGLAS